MAVYNLKEDGNDFNFFFDSYAVGIHLLSGRPTAPCPVVCLVPVSSLPVAEFLQSCSS